MLNFLMKNKLKFLLGFFFNWYVFILVPLISIAYYAISGAEQSGLVQDLKNLVKPHLERAEEAAKTCTQKIHNRDDFVNCLGDPPKSPPQ